MQSFALPSPDTPRRLQLSLAAGGLLLLAAGGALWAQVAGDRGIAPVATSTDIEVRGIHVDVGGKNPEDARENGWREAQRLAWKKLNGPAIPDSRLQSLVSAIVVETEQIGPRRYIADLAVIFDRSRTGSVLGEGGRRARSAPMLTLPVTFSGGTQTMYETRTPWQRAWAEFQAGGSAIDYVRPSGAGGESLLLTYGQTRRRSRSWWNEILDQFGAADVLVPIAELHREWPGGPVVGRFTARHGPDDELLGSFEMRAESEQQLPQMLQQAVRRFDALFAQALAEGKLRPDPTLTLDEVEISPAVRALIEASRRAEADEAAARAAAAEAALPVQVVPPTPTGEEPAAVASFTVQVATPDAGAMDAALASVRGAAGVRSAAISSVAVGGTSVLRVTYAGDLAALAAALRARGWQVTQGSNALAISR
ncbi:conserved hypothetical protein [Altererythrobacter sp. B11]|uniref:heavy-metal-associated domain-containing protein n=1 Tax=Altererythrobacter sp. B11 TaxID=2060312 RepID=UPI000DC6F6F9|nr:heavy-metal-associated domain-containing protein [Altererythrobacter sp. B11]BBC72579.1 conserved hypothetical protein [Altererythrobacter sp. B11]